MSEPLAHTAPAPEGGVEADDINNTAIFVWGTVSVLIVVIVMLGAAALYNEYQAQLNQTRVVAPRYVASEESLITQQAVLVDYDKPSATRSTYIIPIERAKTLVVREMQAKQKASE